MCKPPFPKLGSCSPHTHLGTRWDLMLIVGLEAEGVVEVENPPARRVTRSAEGAGGLGRRQAAVGGERQVLLWALGLPPRVCLPVLGSKSIPPGPQPLQRDLGGDVASAWTGVVGPGERWSHPHGGLERPESLGALVGHATLTEP